MPNDEHRTDFLGFCISSVNESKPGAVHKIDAAYEKGLLDKIFTTNLNYRPQSIIDRPWYAEVNMCKYVSYIIDTLNSDSSISDLLNPVGRIHALVDRVQAANNGELR